MEYPPEVRLEVYDAVIEYAASGKLSEMKPLSKMAFSFIKKELDYNQEKYNETCEMRSQSGKKGGNPNFRKGQTNPYYSGDKKADRHNQTLSKITKDNQTLSKITLYDNEYDNDNDNDVIADAITAREGESTVSGLDEIKAGINAAQAKAEGLCMSYGITPEEYEAIKAEIFAEWEMQGYTASRQDAMNYFVNLMRIKAKDRQKQPKPPDIPLRDRQKALWNEIIGCGVQCPADTQKAFYAKWSETDASGRWMKCELENGFDVKRRLERYVINSDRQWR